MSICSNMVRNRATCVTIFPGMAVAALLSGTALAQTAGPASPAAGPSNGIADIVVTAQRRSENLQNVPIAVSAATAEMLNAKGVQSTEDLAAAIPSLTISATAGYVQPRIRGIGNNVFGAGFESGVATYIDGVYIAAGPSTLFSLSNIDRIEVLKGPQGTLFGRNATGGLIQVITREPDDKPGGTIALTGANYGTLTADAYVTGGLADGVAADFSGHVSTQHKGYGTNLANGQDVNKTDEDISLRSSILIRPGAGTKIRVTADYEKDRGSVYGAVQLAPGTGAPFPHRNAIGTWNVDSDVQPYNRYEGGGISGHIDQDLGVAQLQSITAYRRSSYHIIFDGDATATPAVEINNAESDRQFSQELQLASKSSSPIKWVTGLYYFHANSQWDPSDVEFFGPARKPTPIGVVSGSLTYATLKTDSLAGYAQATAPILDATNLTLGVRYTTEKRSISADQFTLFANGTQRPVPVIPQSKRFSRPTWRASLDHRFSSDLMAYASYNRGFKSGGFNGQFPSDAPFKPEKIDAYEVGIKSDLFDRHLRIDAAAFYYDYTNIQVSRFIGSQISYYNGASAHVYGLDADIVAKLSRSFTLSGGFTVLHDRFTDFPNAVISTQVPNGIIVTTGSAKGNRLPNTPDFTATISGEYHVPVSFGELGLDASYTYNDGYFTQPDNILMQPRYHLVSAGLRATLHDGVTVRVWGKNLANAKIVSTLAAGSLDSNVSYQAPRTYGVTLSAKF